MSTYKTPTVLHLSLLAARPKGSAAKIQRSSSSAPRSVDDLTEDGVVYQSLTCHDWRCNCKLPQSVVQFESQSRPSGYQASVYERGYVVPVGHTLNNEKRLVLDKKTKALKKKPTETDREQDDASLPHIISQGINEDDIGTRKQRSKEQYLWSKMSDRPVSVHGSFLVSGPHWASRGHLQQWPWKSYVQCKLWSTARQYNLTPGPRHSTCWHTTHNLRKNPTR